MTTFPDERWSPQHFLMRNGVHKRIPKHLHIRNGIVVIVLFVDIFSLLLHHYSTEFTKERWSPWHLLTRYRVHSIDYQHIESTAFTLERWGPQYILMRDGYMTFIHERWSPQSLFLRDVLKCTNEKLSTLHFLMRD